MRRFTVLIILLGLVLFGCGAAGSDDPTPTVGSTAISGTVPESTTTSEGAIGTTESPTSAGDDNPDAWDLLYIQDSHGFGVADLYAERVREALGVDVVVHDKAIGDLAAVTVLEHIRGDWSELVRDAEIIVLFGNPNGSGYTSDIGTCISGSTAQREPPTNYSEADWQPYQDLLEEIYAEIWRIREGKPLVLRALTFLNPAISAWREAGIESECTAALEGMNMATSHAAEAGGATVVSTYDLFNGPNHQEDPREKGWIGPDGIHLSSEGKVAMADALAAAGFEPTAMVED